MIDRDFEQVSEEHMKTMTKPEGPAQEQCPHCGLFGIHATSCQYVQFAATPAPSQPAGAREYLRWKLLRSGSMQMSADGEWVSYEDYETLAQQTAAKDAEIERLNEVITILREDKRAEGDDRVAAERERDSLRAENERLRENWKIKAQQFMDDIKRMVEAHEAENAALKAGKDGQ